MVTSASSKSDLAPVHALVQHVTRAFFDTKVIVLYDLLIQSNDMAQKDELLSGKLGMSIKDLAKLAQPLVKQRLLAVFRRNEVKEGSIKATSRSYYFIDFKTFIDVVKWKMFKIRKNIEDKLRDEIKTQGYLCPLCKKAYSTLDINGLVVDPVEGGFRCDICSTILLDNDSADQVEQGKTKIRRLNEQCRYVSEGLKKTESIIIPPFDVKQWLDINHPVLESVTQLKKDPEDGLKIAQGGGIATTVSIQMANDSDIKEEQARKLKESEARRVQNALPSWIAKSTVDGAWTAAGLKDAVPEEQQIPTSPTRSPGKDGGDTMGLEEYYASLASKQPSASNTNAPSPTSSNDEDFEELVSTTIAPVEALNEHGKRSRSPTAEEKGKKAKVETTVIEDDSDEGEFDEVA